MTEKTKTLSFKFKEKLKFPNLKKKANNKDKYKTKKSIVKAIRNFTFLLEFNIFSKAINNICFNERYLLTILNRKLY